MKKNKRLCTKEKAVNFCDVKNTGIIDIKMDTNSSQTYFPEPDKNKIDEFWTHRNCSDGFGAALCHMAYYRWRVSPPVKFPVFRVN